MTTTAPTPASGPAVPSATGDWLVGESYPATVDWSWGQLADRIYLDLCDVRDDKMMPTEAEFQVTPDTAGPVPVLRVTISGLIDAGSPTVPGSGDGDTAKVYTAIRAVYGELAVIGEVMRQAFHLINHYNAVELARPERARFIQHITAVRADQTPAIALVGMMHDDVTPVRHAATPASGDPTPADEDRVAGTLADTPAG